MNRPMTITINGLKVEAPQGMSILDAASNAGIYIPTLCHCPDVTAEGVCRICLVKVAGKKKLLPACRTPIEDGMAIIADDPEIQRIRRVTIELLLSDHNFNCLLCPGSGTCRLQQLVNRIGFDGRRINRLHWSKRELPVDTSNPFFDFNPNKCIQCGICVRTCREITGADAIAMANRGYDLKVSTFGNHLLRDSVCVSCGECMERCPTAALVRKHNDYPSREVRTTCVYCGVGCGICLGEKGNVIVRARGDADNPVNRGELCVRGRFGFRFVHSFSRLSSPLVRNYDPLHKGKQTVAQTASEQGRVTPASIVSPMVKYQGDFVEVTWEQAVKYVASTLSHYKGDQFAAVSSAKCTNEENYVFQKFVRAVMGTNNLDHCARL